MKKFLLTTMALLVFAFTASATKDAKQVEGKYLGQLYIDLTGEVTEDSEPEEGYRNIFIDCMTDSTISFKLPNFGFMGLHLGDICLENIGVKKTNDKLYFEDLPAKKLVFDVTENGMNEQIVATAKINATKSEYNCSNNSLTIFVDVEWINEGQSTPIGVKFTSNKKEEIARYQIQNANFENWRDVNEPGMGWYSFASASAKGFILGTGKRMSKENTLQAEGYKSEKAIKLVSKDFGLAKANGNVTTGCINMGSSTPTDAKNFNFTERSNEHHTLFCGRPDSITCMAKFKRGEEGDYNAQITAIIHGDINFKDPHETEENINEYQVAKAILPITPATEWTYFTAPLKYTGKNLEKTYALVSMTTNPEPGATAKDTLIVDDVKFIYNSELSSATFNGEEINLTTTEKEIKVNGNYTEKDFFVKTNSVSATVERLFDNANQILTITVKGGDFPYNAKNKHVYTFKFGKYDGINSSINTINNNIIYDLQGRNVQEMQRGVYIKNGKKIIIK